MSLKRFIDFFDETSLEISRNGGVDPDGDDSNNEINDPNNPVWDGSEIKYNPYGSDPGLPDPNEITQD